MKLETFIDKLLSIGFMQTDCDNWYTNYINGKSVCVGIMASEVDCLGHLPIEIVYIDENVDDELEIEKDYLTTTGAWKAIQRL